MKTLLFLYLAGNLIAGPKADKVLRLSEVRNEILERQRIEADRKYLVELERLKAALPKGDLLDELAVQKEIWKTKFIGRYQQRGNPTFHVNIYHDGIARQPGGRVGTWEIAEENGKFVFRVHLGDWSFTVAADSTKDYEGTIFYKGQPQNREALTRRK
jgi:hypothetical protein